MGPIGCPETSLHSNPEERSFKWNAFVCPQQPHATLLVKDLPLAAGVLFLLLFLILLLLLL